MGLCPKLKEPDPPKPRKPKPVSAAEHFQTAMEALDLAGEFDPK